MKLPYSEIGENVFHIGKYSSESGKNNSYLVIKREYAILINPGPLSLFLSTFSTVKNIILDKPLEYSICYNADPDVCSSIPLWEKEFPHMTVLTASFCAELIYCYNINLNCLSVNECCTGYTQLPGEYTIELFSSPAIGLFTFDHVSKILFSGKLFCSNNESSCEDGQSYTEEVALNNEKVLQNIATSALKSLQKKLMSLNVNIVAPIHGSIIRNSLIDGIIKRISKNNDPTNQSYRTSDKSFGTLRQRVLNNDNNISNESEVHHTDDFTVEQQTCSTDENTHQMKGEQKNPIICNLVAPPTETPPNERQEAVKQEENEIKNEDIRRIKDENLALKKQIKSIENKLLKCHVTDLYNETYFFEYMKEEVLNSLTYQLNGALLILELDKATTINVEFGLQGLEETLHTMSYLLKETKEDGHFLFKLEGASFGFYIPFCEKEEAFKWAEKFRNTIEKSGNFYCPITVSIGISAVSEFYDDNSSVDMLSKIFTSAKSRLKIAKESGNIVIGSEHKKTNLKNKILIIEYDQFHYDFLNKLLQREGILTVHCSDGYHGLETLEKLLPDIVIAEINLPKVNGYLVREKMLNSSVLKKIPFILVSHIKNPESIKRAAVLKIEYYLKKPYVTEELIGLIKNLLDKVSND